MNELYRYTVMRTRAPKEPQDGVSGVELPAAAGAVLDLDQRPYERPALASVLDNVTRAPTSAEVALRLLNALGLKAGDVDPASALAAAITAGRATTALGAAGAAVRGALAKRPAHEATLAQAASDVVAITTLIEWASGARPDEAWAAGLARHVIRPTAERSPVASTPAASSSTPKAAAKRLEQLVTLAATFAKAGTKQRAALLQAADPAIRATVGNDPQSASARIAAEGDALLRMLVGAGDIAWSGVNANAGFAYKAQPISGDAPTDFAAMLRFVLAGGTLNLFWPWLGDVDARPGPSGLLPTGRQDLIVVRDRHLGYRLAELSHIENVAAGEMRERVHRVETEIETLVSEETEHEQETEEDLTSTSKDELRNEVQTQTREKLDLSGKVRVSYRGPVEVEVEASASYGREDERRTNTTRSHAIEVTEEAASRVRDRVTRRNERRFRRLVAETNRHTFANETGASRSIPYVWLQKVDRLALYQYGERLMYELVIPEPAAHLRALSATAPGPEVPLRPPPTAYFQRLMSGSTDIVAEWTSGALARAFAIDDLAAPAEALWIEQSASATDDTPETAPETRLTVPQGRRGTRMRVSVQTYAPGDGVPLLSLAVGPLHLWVNEDTLSRTSSSDSDRQIQRPNRWQMRVGAGGSEVLGPFIGGVTDDAGIDLGDVALGFITGGWSLLGGGGGDRPAVPGQPYEAFEVDLVAANVPLGPGDYQVKVLASDGSTYSITVAVLTEATDEERAGFRRTLTAAVVQDYWRQYEAYAALALADRPAQGKGLIENLSAAQSAELREIERDEVKRSALAIIRNTDASGPDPMSGARPAAARWYRENRAYADEIMFLEQAFEWQYMSFVLYGYQWSDSADWDLQIFGQRGGDRGFREFLKAGAARVQLPVRPGFEGFVEDYLLDGVVWSGGERPRIGSPGFLDFLEERLESLGVPGKEVPVTEGAGDGRHQPVYWDVTTPTDLVMIRTWDDPADAPLDRMVPPAAEALISAEGAAAADALAGWSPGRGPVPEDPSSASSDDR